MFRYCFLFLYVFVYNCDENKRRLKDAVGSESIFEYFSKISQMELGQSRLLVEYLNDNYQDCIDYSLKST